MAVRTFYLGFTGQLAVDFIQKLHKQHGFTPIYWSADAATLETVRRLFPQTVLHDILQAARGIPAEACRRLKPLPVDRDFAGHFHHNQIIALHMMARMDAREGFSFEERNHHYYRLLRYWRTVLEHYRPDLVLFRGTPHMIYDYVAYFLCRHLGIKTLMFGITSHSKVYVMKELEAGLKEVREDMAANETKEIDSFTLAESSRRHYEYISQRNDADYLFTYRRYVEKYAPPPARFSPGRILSAMIHGTRAVRRFFFAPAPPHYLKLPGRPVEDSRLSGPAWRINKLLGYAKKRRLARCYRRLSGPVDLAAPYIYVPLHYQPENTTCPNGGLYDAQFLLVQMLSDHLPPGWRIYVKEYPNQFDYRLNGERARSLAFYGDLAKLPGVRFTPLDQSSFELIDRSRAVATITGSAGWEAVCRGKPVLLFGYIWYKGCEGVFDCSNAKDLQRALDIIRQGYQVDQRRVQYFLHVLDRHSHRVYVENGWEEEVGVPYQENVDMVARIIAGAYQNY